jgi:hypothetical protein
MNMLLVDKPSDCSAIRPGIQLPRLRTNLLDTRHAVAGLSHAILNAKSVFNLRHNVLRHRKFFDDVVQSLNP